jgi:hypothetical protein
MVVIVAHDDEANGCSTCPPGKDEPNMRAELNFGGSSENPIVEPECGPRTQTGSALEKHRPNSSPNVDRPVFGVLAKPSIVNL